MDEQRFSDLRRRLRFESSDDDAPSTIVQTMADADEVITTLIAEVRRLQQQACEWYGWQEAKQILLVSEMALAADRDAALAERDAARQEIVALDNERRRLTADLTQEAKRADAMQRSCEANYAALTEARRVLKHVRPVLCDVLKVPGCNFDATMDLITELDAAVLAQEEPS